MKNVCFSVPFNLKTESRVTLFLVFSSEITFVQDLYDIIELFPVFKQNCFENLIGLDDFGNSDAN